MDYVEPFTFNASRYFVGGAVLLPVIAVRSRAGGLKKREDPAVRKQLILGGIICGAILFVASALQQTGLLYTTVGKSGFITALYIITVPIFGLFLKKRTGVNVWISVFIATAGMYLLCVTESSFFGRGELLSFLCAVCFAWHILVIDRLAPNVDSVKLCCVQFFSCAIFSSFAMFVFESPEIGSIIAAASPILYTGVLSCGVAYTFQIMGQRDANPAVASLIMSLESVFALLGGVLLMGEAPTARELLGCLLMFGAIVLSQFSLKKKSEKEIKNFS